MKIKKDDQVLILSGKDKGKKGKVLKAYPELGRVMVEGVNLRKKHQKPKRQGEKGQIVTIPGLIAASSVKVICPRCGKPTRIGYEVSDKGKFRICKKCNQTI